MMRVETMTCANEKQAVPFFGVTKMEASLRFHVGWAWVQNEALLDSRSGGWPVLLHARRENSVVLAGAWRRSDFAAGVYAGPHSR
jgi:hypothetical protein